GLRSGSSNRPSCGNSANESEVAPAADAGAGRSGAGMGYAGGVLACGGGKGGVPICGGGRGGALGSGGAVGPKSGPAAAEFGRFNRSSCSSGATSGSGRGGI